MSDWKYLESVVNIYIESMCIYWLYWLTFIDWYWLDQLVSIVSIGIDWMDWYRLERLVSIGTIGIDWIDWYRLERCLSVESFCMFLSMLTMEMIWILFCWFGNFDWYGIYSKKSIFTFFIKYLILTFFYVFHVF